jgi:hypothetical protein
VTAWWESTSNLADLVEWLDRTEPLDMTIVCDLLRHPELFEPEWNEFQAMLVERAAWRREREDDSTLEPLLQASLAVARGARGVR